AARRARTLAVSEHSRRLAVAQTTDLAVAQAVVDEREHLARHRHARLLLPPPIVDATEVLVQPVPAVVAGDGLQRRPAHQARAHLGDPTPHHLGVRLPVTGRQPRPGAQRGRRAEARNVADPGPEDGGDGAPHAGERLDRLIALVPGEALVDLA